MGLGMGMGMGRRRPTFTLPSPSTLRAMRGMRSIVLARHQPRLPLGKDLGQGHISRRTISSSSPERQKSAEEREEGFEEQPKKSDGEADKPLERSKPWRRLSIAECLRWKPESEEDRVIVQGYVRSVRGMKTHRFVALGDGSSLAPLQAVVPVDTDEAEGCDHYLHYLLPCNISEPHYACLGYQKCSIKY